MDLCALSCFWIGFCVELILDFILPGSLRSRHLGPMLLSPAFALHDAYITFSALNHVAVERIRAQQPNCQLNSKPAHFFLSQMKI